MRIHVLASVLLTTALATTTARGQSPLTTLFAANGAGGPGWTLYFDVEAINGIDITQLDINVNAGVGTTGSIDVYVGPAGSTYVGNQLNGIGNAPWPATPTATGTATAAGVNQPTSCVLTPSVTLTPDTYAVMVVYQGLAPAYTNGDMSFSNNEIVLSAGSVTSAASSGILFNGRTWNGSIHYSTLPGYATATPYGNGCGRTPPRTIYEWFRPGSNPNDLSNTAFELIWTGNPSYTLVPSVQTIVNPTVAETPFTDDDVQMHTLPFAIPTEIGVTTDIWIGSNGFIGFQAITNTGAGEDITEFLRDAPRLAAYWDDLDPSSATGSGSIHLQPDPITPSTRFHVTWDLVSQYFGSGGTPDQNTFQVTFNANGTIECKYGAMAAMDGIVGYTPGQGAEDPGSSDLSAITSFALGTGTPDMSLIPGSRPVLGTMATCTLNDIPAPAVTASAPGAFLIGANGYMPGLPLDVVGMLGCELLSDGRLTSIPFVATGPSETLSLGISGALQGVRLFVQGAVISIGSNNLGVVTSSGVRWKIDNL